MGRIRLLDDDVASQVAAGEVVERPASVLKELVENSIDAGATRVSVEFSRGGTRLVRVVDNGCGMDREDALLSLERHATSKIRSAADLASVATMGFRGEALPSIASVSRFRLRTRPATAQAGTEIEVAGGKIAAIRECGMAPGTSIDMESIFFNLPARRKFLRGEETESAHLLHQAQSIALAHPGVALSIVRDGRLLWQAAATEDLAVRIRDVLGPDFLSKLRPLSRTGSTGLALHGFIAKPGEGRPDRELQFVILNRRVVRCPAVSQSLREAYADALPKGRHPMSVLCLELDPLSFDCNVHPAKREVRLHRPDLVRQAVYVAVRATLESPSNTRATPSPDPVRSIPSRMPAEIPGVPRPGAPSSPPPQVFRPAPLAPRLEFSQDPPQMASPRPGPERYRLIGDLGKKWILMEGEEGLVLVDSRAANERILFERLRREIASGPIPSQRLLLPAMVQFPPKEAIWISGNLDPLHRAGFQLEAFGGGTFKVEAVPACLEGGRLEAVLLDVCEGLKASGSLGIRDPILDSLVRSVSRLAARDSSPFDAATACRLVDDLLRCDLPYACPQGRPTMIQWSFGELERKFGR